MTQRHTRRVITQSHNGHAMVDAAALAAFPLPASLRGPMTLTQALNEHIKEVLKREQWSQREFAKRLGRSQTSVSYLLSQKRRQNALAFYEDLATVFGMALSDLVKDLELRVLRANRGASRVKDTSDKRFAALVSFRDQLTHGVTLPPLSAEELRLLHEHLATLLPLLPTLLKGTRLQQQLQSRAKKKKAPT